MTNNLKAAFDGIRAEEELKESTLLYLQHETQKRSSTRRRSPPFKFAAVLASAAVLLLSGVFTYTIYFTPRAFVDIDVNPSIELSLNRFNKIIHAGAYNGDGNNILSGLSLNHRNYQDAIAILIDAMEQGGYIQNGGLISVTLQTDNASMEAVLLSDLQASVIEVIEDHNHTALVDVFPVSGDTRGSAHELGVSPAKYLAIQELITVDPTTTAESCRGRSISEIRQMAQSHTGGHHSGYNVVGTDEIIGESANNGAQDSGNGNGHHGESGGGHHGGGKSANENTMPVKITAAEAYNMLADNADIILLDVRTEGEYNEKHIEGALLIPDYELKSRAESELPDKNAVILVYCRSGRRSANAALDLSGMGYTSVYDFGGILSWPYETTGS